SALTIEKASSVSEAYLGDEVTFTITIRNIGNQPLSGIKVTDALLGYDSTLADALEPDPIGTLNPGEEWSVTLKKTMDTLGAFTNTARVESTDQEPAFEPQEDSATVEVLAVPEYGVDIKKSVTTEDTDEGLAATYTVTVRNIGNQPLPAVLVKDEALGFEQTVSLAVGEAKVFVMPVVTYTIEGTYENTATAEDPGEVDLFEKKLATATVIYIPEEEPPYNPVTGQGGIWAAIMGALAAVTVALGLFGRRRRAMYRR
ncbi:MAG: DUF11 domain-containing protein, partial [Christensenellales bacterium]